MLRINVFDERRYDFLPLLRLVDDLEEANQSVHALLARHPSLFELY